MGELDHHGAAVLVTVVGQTLQMRDDLVLPGEQIAEGGRAVATDAGRTRRHRKRDAALRLFDMVER